MGDDDDVDDDGDDKDDDKKEEEEDQGNAFNPNSYYSYTKEFLAQACS